MLRPPRVWPIGAVRAPGHAEFGDNHDYALALHTDTPRPHVRLAVQAEGFDRTRFNPRPRAKAVSVR